MVFISCESSQSGYLPVSLSLFCYLSKVGILYKETRAPFPSASPLHLKTFRMPYSFQFNDCGVITSPVLHISLKSTRSFQQLTAATLPPHFVGGHNTQNTNDIIKTELFHLIRFNLILHKMSQCSICIVWLTQQARTWFAWCANIVQK